MNKANFGAAVQEAPLSFSLALLDAPIVGADNVVRHLKIFKAGTFADSLGRVATWTNKHLEAMVAHFAHLRDLGVLPNVPVRIDHTVSMKDVVGWFHNVYLDPNEPGFLFGDIEFTEPDARAKYDRKTLRNRSIEVGAYETNTGEKFEPVVLGLAFVDLPAVEGLFRSPNAPTSAHSATGDQSPGTGSAPNNQGDTMSGTTTTTSEPGTGTTPPATPPATPPETPPATPPASSTEPATHARSANTAHTFRVNGAETTDYSAVQAHIATLETFRAETLEHTRTSFVDGLAAANKITNPMKESFRALVLTMTAAQFEAFAKGWDNAPAANMLGQIEVGGTGTPPPAGGTQPTELDDLREIVANHRRSGMTEEALVKTKSYRRLQELTAAGKS